MKVTIKRKRGVVKMDFIETLTAIVKEVINEPGIKNDDIFNLVKCSDDYRDFTGWVLSRWANRIENRSQAKKELFERLRPLQLEFEKIRIERERIKTESDPLNIIIKELRELKEQNKLILKELQGNENQAEIYFKKQLVLLKNRENHE